MRSCLSCVLSLHPGGPSSGTCSLCVAGCLHTSFALPCSTEREGIDTNFFAAEPNVYCNWQLACRLPAATAGFQSPCIISCLLPDSPLQQPRPACMYRCAERLVFGEDRVSTSGSDDVLDANYLAREMVYRFGFNKRLGPVALMDDDEVSCSGTRVDPKLRAWGWVPCRPGRLGYQMHMSPCNWGGLTELYDVGCSCQPDIKTL